MNIKDYMYAEEPYRNIEYYQRVRNLIMNIEFMTLDKYEMKVLNKEINKFISFVLVSNDFKENIIDDVLKESPNVTMLFIGYLYDLHHNNNEPLELYKINKYKYRKAINQYNNCTNKKQFDFVDEIPNLEYNNLI